MIELLLKRIFMAWVVVLLVAIVVEGFLLLRSVDSMDGTVVAFMAHSLSSRTTG